MFKHSRIDYTEQGMEQYENSLAALLNKWTFIHLILCKTNESNHISHKPFFSLLHIHFMHFIARVHKIFEVKITIHI